jgi:hypothetical protein
VPLVLDITDWSTVATPTTGILDSWQYQSWTFDYLGSSGRDTDDGDYRVTDDNTLRLTD